MNIQAAFGIAKRVDKTTKAFCEEMKAALPVGSVIEIRRGRTDTRTKGWLGPYEVRAHGFNDPCEVVLYNNATGKVIRWHVSSYGDNIREPRGE